MMPYLKIVLYYMQSPRNQDKHIMINITFRFWVWGFCSVELAADITIAQAL